jgi:hypothetical protein
MRSVRCALLLAAVTLAGCGGEDARSDDRVPDGGDDAATAAGECSRTWIEASIDGAAFTGGDATVMVSVAGDELTVYWMQGPQFVLLRVPAGAGPSDVVDLTEAPAAIDLLLPELGSVSSVHAPPLNATLSGTLRIERGALVAGERACGELDATVAYGAPDATHVVALRGEFDAVLDMAQILRPN